MPPPVLVARVRVARDDDPPERRLRVVEPLDSALIEVARVLAETTLLTTLERLPVVVDVVCFCELDVVALDALVTPRTLALADEDFDAVVPPVVVNCVDASSSSSLVTSRVDVPRSVASLAARPPDVCDVPWSDVVPERVSVEVDVLDSPIGV